MYNKLINDRTAKNQNTYTLEEYAQSKSFFVERGYPTAELELALKNLKDFQPQYASSEL